MDIMEIYGLAMRDGVYESFMEVAKVTDLEELKAAGYSVKEFLLDKKNEWDKLLILVKEDKIYCGCTIVIITKAIEGEQTLDVDVEFLTGLQAKEALRRLKRAR